MPPRRKPPTAPVRPSPSTAAATSDHDGQVQDPSSREHSTIASTSRRKPTRPTTATSVAAAATAPHPPEAAQNGGHHQPHPQWPASAVRQRSFLAPEWPHANQPSLAPQVMAGAGFFFDPALTDADNPDNVTCFECAKQLSHWDPQQDDPAAIHFQKSPQCAYARAICLPKVLYSWTTNVLDGSGGLLYDEADPSTYPKAEEMVNMRKKTFEGRWVHDRNPKFFANSTRLAKAGFVYDPDPADDAWTSLDDKATCVYCNLSLANWEPKDNPLTEHKKRNPSCPFFAHITKPRTKRAPTADLPAARTRRQQPAPAPQVAVVKQEPEPEPEPKLVDSPPRRGRGRPRKTPVVEVQSADTDKPAVPRRGRGRPPKVAAATAAADAAASPQSGVDTLDDPFKMPAEPPLTRPSTSKPAAKRKAPGDAEQPAPHTGPAGAGQPAPPPSTARATRSRAPTAAAANPPVVPSTRTLRRRRQPGHDEEHLVKHVPPAQDDDDDEPPLKRQRRSSMPPTHIVEVEIPVVVLSQGERAGSQDPPTPQRPHKRAAYLEKEPLKELGSGQAAATETGAVRRGVRKPAVASTGKMTPPIPTAHAAARLTSAPAPEPEQQDEHMDVDGQADEQFLPPSTTDHDPIALPNDPSVVKVTYGGRRSRSSLTHTPPLPLLPPPPMQLPLSPPRPPVLDAHPTSPTPMDSPARTSGRGRRVSIGHMAQDKQADAHGVGAPANAKAADVVELPVSQSQTSAQGPAASQAATASKTSLSSQPRSRSSGPTRPKTAAPPARLASPAKPIPSMSPEMDSPVRSSPRRARSRSSLSAASATSSLSHIRHRDPLAAATPAPAPATKLLDLARDPSLKPSRADLNPVLLEYVRQARANMPADDRRLVNLPAALANVFANAAREKARATFAGTVALMFRPESEFKKMVEEEAERERLRLAQRT